MFGPMFGDESSHLMAIIFLILMAIIFLLNVNSKLERTGWNINKWCAIKNWWLSNQFKYLELINRFNCKCNSDQTVLTKPNSLNKTHFIFGCISIPIWYLLTMTCNIGLHDWWLVLVMFMNQSKISYKNHSWVLLIWQNDYPWYKISFNVCR